MLHKIIGTSEWQIVLNNKVIFTASNDHLQDILRSAGTPYRSVILLELFQHYQQTCKDTASYRTLFTDFFYETHEFLYPRLTFEALRFLNDRIYGDTGRHFPLDNNIKPLLELCAFYTRNIEHSYNALLEHKSISPAYCTQDHAPEAPRAPSPYRNSFFHTIQDWHAKRSADAHRLFYTEHPLLPLKS